MEEKMFCFQCQEACRNTGCTFAGMCGKKAETANLMDDIIRQLNLDFICFRPGRRHGQKYAEHAYHQFFHHFHPFFPFDTAIVCKKY